MTDERTVWGNWCQSRRLPPYTNSAGGETTLCGYFYAKWAKAADSNLPGPYFGWNSVTQLGLVPEYVCCFESVLQWNPSKVDTIGTSYFAKYLQFKTYQVTCIINHLAKLPCFNLLVHVSFGAHISHSHLSLRGSVNYTEGVFNSGSPIRGVHMHSKSTELHIQYSGCCHQHIAVISYTPPS